MTEEVTVKKMSQNEQRMWLAVAAFRDVERVEFLLERKRRDLRNILSTLPKNMIAAYYRNTQHVLKEYDEKRTKAKL